MSFASRVVWITGASSGIGEALSRALLADGALPVARPAVDPAALERLRAEPERVAHWEARLAEVRALRQDRSS